jgi:hypothetical protein
MQLGAHMVGDGTEPFTGPGRLCITAAASSTMRRCPTRCFFNGGDAFHDGSVTVRSNGCVHLTQPAAQTFYNTLHVGDEVQVLS